MRFVSFSSLRARLLLIVFLALTPALILIYYDGVEKKHKAAAEAKIEAMRLVGLASTNHKHLIDDAHNLLLRLAESATVAGWTGGGCDGLLADALRKHPQYLNIGIAGPDGGILCSAVPLSPTDGEVSISDRYYFQRAIQTRNFAVGTYQMGRISKALTLNFGYPLISNEGDVEAVLFCALDLARLVSSSSEAALAEGMVLTIRDSTGTILFRYPDERGWSGHPYPEAPVAKTILFNQGWGTAEAAGIDGVQRLYAFAPLSPSFDTDVYLSVGIETRIAFARAEQEMNRNLLYLSLAAVLALGAAWLGGNLFVMNQVDALMAVTRRLATGDLHTRCDALRGSSELGELARAFNIMAESLDQRTRELQKAESKYRALVEQVPAVTYSRSLDDPGKMSYVSPQIESVLGFSPSHWTNDSAPWTSQLHPDDRDRVLAEFARTAPASPRHSSMEYRLLAKDGRAVWVRDEWQAVPGETGSAPVTSGILRDITDRKLAEEAFRSSEETCRQLGRRLQLILESAGEGIFGLDSEGLVTFMNPAATQVCGWEINEVLGRSHHEMMHHTRPNGTIYPVTECPIYAALREGGVHHAADEVFWRKDGTAFPIEYISTPIYEEGSPAGAVVCFKDISERKRAESDLVRAGEEWKRTFDAVPDLIMLLDTKHRVLRANRAMAEKLGMDPETLVGRPCYELMHGTTEPPEHCPHTQTLADGRRHSLEVNEKHLNSEYMVTTSPLHDSAGLVVGSVHVAHDITERKQAEQERALMAEAIEQASDGILITDRNATILYSNPSFLELSGYKTQEIVGRNLETLRRSRPGADLYNRMYHEISQENAWSGRVAGRMRDGQLCQFETTISPIRDASGRIIHFVVLNRDITHEIALENQLRHSQKMEAIGTLAGGIAHDFNNILAAILGYTELTLLADPEDRHITRNLEQVLKAAHRARDLVRQILVFSRHAELQEKKPLDIHPFVKEGLELLRASLPATIEIRQNIQGGMVLADPTQIHQILVNLCTNASHAMGGKGMIDVSLTTDFLPEDDPKVLSNLQLKPGLYVKLKVSDTGHGMDEPTLQRIFDPYFTTKAIGKGTGLGLAVVHGIVNRHEGAIVVQSTPGEGTVFEIFLPRVEQLYEQPVPSSNAIPVGTERILLVDDEAAVADFCAAMLRRLGYRVEALADPTEACSLFRRKPLEFDLVMTDYTMPHMTGTELSIEILKLRPDIPIILCTGYSENVTEDSARALGIAAFAMKPLERTELANIVRKALDARQAGAVHSQEVCCA